MITNANIIKMLIRKLLCMFADNRKMRLKDRWKIEN